MPCNDATYFAFVNVSQQRIPYWPARLLCCTRLGTDQSKGREVLKFFEHNPDFILFKKDKSSLYLVEVKYRHELDLERVREIAEEEVKQSDHIWLFLATPNGFFFSQCKDIVRTGAIQPLSPKWVSPEIQRGYLGLLKEFIK